MVRLPLKVLSPANVCVPVVTNPLDEVPASGIFNVIFPDEVIGLFDTFTSLPLVPVVNPTDVTVPDVINAAKLSNPFCLLKRVDNSVLSTVHVLCWAPVIFIP